MVGQKKTAQGTVKKRSSAPARTRAHKATPKTRAASQTAKPTAGAPIRKTPAPKSTQPAKRTRKTLPPASAFDEINAAVDDRLVREKRRGPAKLSEHERSASIENLMSLLAEEADRVVEHHVEAAKYDIGIAHEEPPSGYELPYCYGVDRVILLVVEPRFVFAYWEVTDETLSRTARQLGAHPKLTLRFYDTSAEAQNGQYPNWDIEVFDRVGNWYLRLEHPEQHLVIEVGMKDEAGNFCGIARSNFVKLPRESLAPPGPIRWMTVGPDGEKVITDVEEYTDKDHELLKRILGPHFYGLLIRGAFQSIVGSSMEAVFQDIASFKYHEMLPSSSPSAWQNTQSHK